MEQSSGEKVRFSLQDLERDLDWKLRARQEWTFYLSHKISSDIQPRAAKCAREGGQVYLFPMAN